MATINFIVVSGRLTAEPVLKYTQSGTAVANVSIAVTDGYGDNEKTFFFDLEAWKHNAEYLANYAKKGMPVTVAGKLTQQSWQGEDGKNRHKNVIRVNDVVLPPKGKEENASPFGLGEEVITFQDDDLPW